MVIAKFCIVLDKPDKIYYPGETVTGKVELVLNAVKVIKGIELKLKGRAKCEWNKTETYTDSGSISGRSARTICYKETETYLKNKQTLVGGGDNFDMPMGEHIYPFAVTLPSKAPSSYSGVYGRISYYAKAKIDIPMALSKIERSTFTVRSTLDLNLFPSLKNPYRDEKSKTFFCLCCVSGPLSMVVLLPRTGFAASERIPITLEVENASNVAVNEINIFLKRKIRCKAEGCYKDEDFQLQKLRLDGVEGGGSHTWSENLKIPVNSFPILECCSIINVDHELHIEAGATGMHSDLNMNIPITIGDRFPKEDLAPQAQTYPNPPYNPGMQPNLHGGTYTNPVPCAYAPNYSPQPGINPGYSQNVPHLPVPYPASPSAPPLS